MPHQAEILAVGTELLLGNIANTNAQFLSELLASAGIDVLYHTAVGDNPRRLRQAVEIARGRCDLLVFTGGLGPTYDDMTKETVAEAFGLALEYHPEVMEEIRRYFDNVFHRPMPACNRQQAMLPQGCTVLHNPVGTAPGCIFTAARRCCCRGSPTSAAIWRSTPCFPGFRGAAAALSAATTCGCSA